jgi:hypothetical protein
MRATATAYAIENAGIVARQRRAERRELGDGFAWQSSLALPLVIVAQQRHMLFELRFDFSKREPHRGCDAARGFGGMQRRRRKSESKREFEFFPAANAFDAGMQLNQVGLVMLHELSELRGGSLGDQFDRLVPFNVLEAD